MDENKEFNGRCYIIADAEGRADIELGPGESAVTICPGQLPLLMAEIPPGHYTTRAVDLTGGVDAPFPLVICVCSQADAAWLAGLCAAHAADVAERIMRAVAVGIARRTPGGPTLH